MRYLLAALILVPLLSSAGGDIRTRLGEYEMSRAVHRRVEALSKDIALGATCAPYREAMAEVEKRPRPRDRSIEADMVYSLARAKECIMDPADPLNRRDMHRIMMHAKAELAKGQ